MDSVDYSIIIPHKNIPELLQRCINSIPQRDDLEIIVVDNNSSPELVDFDHFPGMDRSEVVMVRDNVSKGAGGARNTGVAIARGKWILFIDADDMFNDCINQILDDYKYVTDFDVVYFDISYLISVNPNIEKNGISRIHQIIELHEKQPEIAENLFRYSYFYPWGKLIDRQLFSKEGVFFEDSIIMNDVAFSYRLGYYAKKISIDDRKIQSVIMRQGSVSCNQSVDSYLERIRIKTEADCFYKEHFIPVTYLGYNNYLFFFKMILKFPLSFHKGIDVIHRSGKNYAQIIAELLYAGAWLLWRKIVKMIGFKYMLPKKYYEDKAIN